MTNEQILDRMCQIIRVGFVNARLPEKMRVKVTLPDTVTSPLVTDWLPVLCPRASQDMQYDLPDVGDQVLCLFLPYGLEQGFVVGAMYGKQAPPVQSGDKWHRTFSDGTCLEYDRVEHKLMADVKGDIEVLASGTSTIKSEGPMTLEAPIIYTRGKFISTDKDGSPGKSVFSGGMEILNGGVAVPDADVVASTVSLVSHIHTGVQPGDGTSNVPVGGGSSPGTGTQGGSGGGSGNAPDNTEKHLEALRGEVRERGSETDQLIMCLPEIAEAMAEKETEPADKLGWIYLRDMFVKWLSKIANEYADTCDEALKVSWDWVFSFNRSLKAYLEITDDSYLFSPNAQKLLARRLMRDGKITNQKEEFDYISGSWRNWPHDYFQSKGVPSQQLYLGAADGLMAAMGAFMIYALAKGYVEPSAEGHKIIIVDVALVVFDRFNFIGTQTYYYWRCSPPDYSLLNKSGYLELTNDIYRNFRKNFGRGYDFSVISGPHYIENNKNFVYEIYL